MMAGPHPLAIRFAGTALMVLSLVAQAARGAEQPLRPPLEPRVEVEEEVYHYQPADNGAGPMWCSGSTSLVRIGDAVFASGLETIENQIPLNNCRWSLYERGGNGWQLRQADAQGRTREPSPLAAFHDGRVVLSANPTLTGPERANGPARPELLLFRSSDPAAPMERLLPVWDGAPEFTEHSYRSLAADGPRGELVLFQNIGYTHAEWSFRDAQGQWPAQGKLAWPWGAEYEEPQPIRICYPNVMLKNRAVYFCGVSDIVEPNMQWRQYKKQLTGRAWDYDFRRLFFTWSDDIAQGEFHPWIEIASREQTCGWISPADLWVSADGAVHLLWIERAIDTRLRDKFYPDARQSQSLNYALVRDGQVAARRTLAMSQEDGGEEVPAAARFHIAAGDRQLVVYYVNGRGADGSRVSENRLLELSGDGEAAAAVRLPLDVPFSQFFTATVRGGSAPSPLLDMLGTRPGRDRAIDYARIRLW